MEVILIIVFLIGLYFAIRFFALSKTIKNSNENLKEVLKDLEANRRINIGSPHKELEDLLSTMNDYLELTQKERIYYIRKEEDFRKNIENVSHDLRTPLTSILGYIDLIEKDKLAEDEREYLDIVRRKAKSLQRLVAHFYDLSRLESNNYQLNLTYLDINKSVRETMLSYYQDFENHNIDVKLELGEEVTALLDESEFERVLTNLIQNTLKYARTDFSISVTNSDKTIRIEFENDAEDLNEEDVSHLFERFYRKDNARNSHSTGLGLTITKHLVQAMGGDIIAELKNQRLRFIVTFKAG